jgi:hypothetical protein
VPVPAAEDTGARTQPLLAVSAGTAAAQDVLADTSVPAQQVALMRLAETAEGRALLEPESAAAAACGSSPWSSAYSAASGSAGSMHCSGSSSY